MINCNVNGSIDFYIVASDLSEQEIIEGLESGKYFVSLEEKEIFENKGNKINSIAMIELNDSWIEFSEFDSDEII